MNCNRLRNAADRAGRNPIEGALIDKEIINKAADKLEEYDSILRKIPKTKDEVCILACDKVYHLAFGQSVSIKLLMNCYGYATFLVDHPDISYIEIKIENCYAEIDNMKETG